MHELGLAQALLEQVRAVAHANGDPRVETVRVRVGEYAGADGEALRFAFDTLRGDYGWPAAVLVLERVPAQLRCPACGTARPLAREEPFAGADELRCARCGAAAELILARELELTSIDVADD
ncbi:MAG TPA: hydrogenase maturation nickel metallochaperone HypA [bacterium]|nr:hydrogenase maturation nickel metallochaperone HypA [bacterium]